MTSVVVVLVTLLLLVAGHPKNEYGMVIDAGSTRSTLYIYQWKYRQTSNSIPPRSFPSEYVASNNSRPGIAQCCESYKDMEIYLTPFISFCQNQLSKFKKHWSSYPIYLKATAGMRILSMDKRIQVLGWVNQVFSNQSVNPFLYNENQGIIISGEEEGLFGWMSANYLENVLETKIDNKNTQTTPNVTYGALDMGGMSLQITFEPEFISDILADFTTLQLWQNNYRLYTHSYLRYGSNGFEQQIAQYSYNYYVNTSKDINSQTIYNPCIFTGLTKWYNVTNYLGQYQNVTEIGNNKNTPTLCSKFTKTLFYNDTVCVTGDGSCAINGVYQPPVPQNIIFYALSGFAYTIEGLGLEDNISLFEISQILDEISVLSYNSFKENTSYGQTLVSNGQIDEFGYSRFLVLTYIYEILANAFGFPINNTNIIYTTSLKNQSLGWAQGSMIRDINWNYYTLNDDNGLTNKGKSYLIATITLAVVISLTLAIILYLCCKPYIQQDSYGRISDNSN